MSYQLEFLQPDQFQEMVQALLLKTYPDLQCFPVGQKDGGRDGVSFNEPGGRRSGFHLFQVKFTRHPEEVKDRVAWLEQAVKDEIPKVREQAFRGAKRYLLITNVRGTAAKDTGEIDRLQTFLNDTFDIPSQCWWRDDVERRLDDAWDIKWAYPKLLTGTDILRSILESGLAEGQLRRASVMQAMISSQYDTERSVKFKQVELHNYLVDLFVDTPLLPIETSSRRESVARLHWDLSQIRTEKLIQRGERKKPRESNEPNFVGAASFFLNSFAQSLAPRVVVEGAPGQGKSTITQYICQVHRMRLLSKHFDLERIPQEHRECAVRLPIRVDLRDLATWVTGRNPFGKDSTEQLPSTATRSLEAFLAALIQHASGGSEFDVADLHAVARVTSLLLVFDGLDEVADIKGRADIVTELKAGVNRLTSIAASVQVIVTSRPAAFGNAPGMPRDT